MVTNGLFDCTLIQLLHTESILSRTSAESLLSTAPALIRARLIPEHPCICKPSRRCIERTALRPFCRSHRPLHCWTEPQLAFVRPLGTSLYHPHPLYSHSICVSFLAISLNLDLAVVVSPPRSKESRACWITCTDSWANSVKIFRVLGLAVLITSSSQSTLLNAAQSPSRACLARLVDLPICTREAVGLRSLCAILTRRSHHRLSLDCFPFLASPITLHS
jgi:hypothetical protein